MNLKHIKILLLTANPVNTSQLRLSEEVRSIQEGLERAKDRDHFELITKLAVRTTDFSRALLDHQPQIVHFSGHGEGKWIAPTSPSSRQNTTHTFSEDAVRDIGIVPELSTSGDEGLVLEDDQGRAKLVNSKTLKELFKSFPSVECVLLNACYSEVQATSIHESVDCVIGMNQPIGDRAAIQFSQGFYDALGAGTSYEEAYQLGCRAIDLEGSSEYLTPVLKYRKGRHSVPGFNQDSTQSEIVPEPLPLVDPMPNSPQSFGNITISGSNTPFNAIQAGGNVNLSQSNIQSHGSHPDLESAVSLLVKLKQEVSVTDALSSFAKKDTEARIVMLQEELQKQQPDKSLVNEVIEALKQGLSGVLTLAELMTQVATFVAKAWVGIG
ncbi:CHAT domain-containing protein [Acaryochloris marina]|uniref:CHAT domain-containing protein n=1 Tax=Acaryochloris marina TaxID=155978 RepID=UPI001BAEEC4E|nr:CHAT domain-containing protein [Acaryochloris marina]QUY45850.1 CHAT domain-containing protein [Acaryochloris marina S15]